MIFAIDIDGTITVEEDGYTECVYLNRTPRLSVINKIKGLYEKGHTIILHSSRHLVDEKVTREWLSKHQVPFHGLVLGKIHADYYVDTRNVSVNQFLTEF